MKNHREHKFLATMRSGNSIVSAREREKELKSDEGEHSGQNDYEIDA